MELRRFDLDNARPVSRPGCQGLSAAVIQLPAALGERLGQQELARRYQGAPILLDQPTVVVWLSFEEQAEMDEHDAPFPILFLVVGGSGFVRVGGPRAEPRAVTVGDALLWPPHVLHKAWTAGEPMRAISIEFAGGD